MATTPRKSPHRSRNRWLRSPRPAGPISWRSSSPCAPALQPVRRGRCYHRGLSHSLGDDPVIELEKAFPRHGAHPRLRPGDVEAICGESPGTVALPGWPNSENVTRPSSHTFSTSTSMVRRSPESILLGGIGRSSLLPDRADDAGEHRAGAVESANDLQGLPVIHRIAPAVF
jgi:hypothetical protein